MKEEGRNDQSPGIQRKKRQKQEVMVKKTMMMRIWKERVKNQWREKKTSFLSPSKRAHSFPLNLRKKQTEEEEEKRGRRGPPQRRKRDSICRMVESPGRQKEKTNRTA